MENNADKKISIEDLQKEQVERFNEFLRKALEFNSHENKK